MSNLYHDTAVSAVATPPLDGDMRADVAVVGGGFTGLSTALHLAERGTRVVLIEAEEPGWGASGRNGGQVNPGLKLDPDVVELQFGADLGARMNTLSGDAPEQVFALIARLGIECAARRNGTLRAAVSEYHAAKVRESTAQWQRRGAAVEVLEGDALDAMLGTRRYPAAMYDRRGGDLNPLSYARELARAALAAGATLHGATRARRLVERDGRYQVLTDTGSIDAGAVVLATNGYTDELWPGLRRSIVPLFGAIAASAPLPEAVARAVMPGRAVLYESGAITVYYRVDESGRLLIGGRGPQREVSSTRALPHLLAYARKLWPALEGGTWTHAWGGRLAMTRDHYPHLHEPRPGLLMGLGYNGRGVAMSTVMGMQIAKRLLQPTEPLDLPITPIQPIPLHGLWPLAVRAAIAKGRLLGVVGR